MPSLIGNKPNQVPSNGDLGTLAFQDANAVNITGGVVDVSAGTAALPTLGTTGDPDTGIFFPAADTIAFTEGGVEAMRINSSGNVGIGTSSPNAKLQVAGTMQVSVGSTTIQMFADGGSNYLQAVGAFPLELKTTGAAPMVLHTNNTERMRITSAGNVGIGTSSPTRKLHVVQNATISTSSFDTSTFSQFLGTSGVSASTSLGFQATTADGSQGYAAITCVPTSNYRSGLIATYTGDAFGTGYFAINRYAATGSTSEVLRADSIGNVGIGTSSPTEKLQVNGVIKSTSDGNLTSGAAAHLYYTSGTSSAELVALNPGVGWLNQTYKALSHQFSISGTERMRLDASGNLGLGVTPSAWTGSHKVFQFGSTSSVYSLSGSTAVNENSYNDGTNRYLTTNFATRYLQATGQHIWFNAPSGTAGNAITFTQAMTLDASGNLQLGTTTAVTSNGTNLNIYGASASNLSLQNATSGTGNNNGFQLIQDGVITYLQNRENGAMTFATNNTERMRIDSSGNLLVGTTADPSSSNGGFKLSKAANGTFISNATTATDNWSHLTFINGNGTVGTIATNGTATAYNTSSDYRLKENIAPMTGALATVSQLKPVTYNWKADGSEGQGFIAHELAEVCPDAVTGEKDAVDEEGKPVHQSIDTSFLVATLTAAIQEQQTFINNLTTRLNALEGK